jgi:hypothetical protein
MKHKTIFKCYSCSPGCKLVDKTSFDVGEVEEIVIPKTCPFNKDRNVKWMVIKHE